MGRKFRSRGGWELACNGYSDGGERGCLSTLGDVKMVREGERVCQGRRVREEIEWRC